ncbi:M4 family metallopeptidase [Ferruginibacter yonginensis]|uniref:M4 family metallopeptidase n=1 Tax=Ferruginibacter yonginensis TaxID=1310416 RepID=A0ABV8QQL4_9BACT
MKYFYQLLTAVCITVSLPVFAQNTLLKETRLSPLEKLLKDDVAVDAYELDPVFKTVQTIQFKTQQAVYKQKDVNAVLARYFTNYGDYSFVNSTVINNDVQVIRYQQLYHQLKVTGSTIVFLIDHGNISFVNASVAAIKNSVANTPLLTADAALQQAVANIGAQRYMWQEKNMGDLISTEKPTPTLVLVNDMFHAKGIRLAYHFDVYASEPISRTNIYIDALDGTVLVKDDIIKHVNANGTADTRYSGNKSITTDFNGTLYRLRSSYGNMFGIDTYNMQKGTNYGAAVDFTDANNAWTTAEFNNTNKDNAALDAHWGATEVYNYWRDVHNRNSYDNAGGKIISYVHFANAFDNAYWNGLFMTYGDGSNVPPSGTTGFKPLTSLDVCAHEIGHAICSYTSNLTYQNESGAMNEGFSDIWAACLENRVDPTAAVYEPFLIGEQITPGWIKGTNRLALRDMKNPNAQGQPDTYLGTLWATGAADNGGVHTNSGVLNKWFYVLTVGETGTNDNSNVYNVTGVGFSKSEKIAYLTETLLTASATHATARTASITAATTLYGACSPEVIATTNAWYAVGVGAVYSATCTPAVHFMNATTTVTEAVASNTCKPSKTISVALRLDANATQNTTVTFTTTGSTALVGKDFDISPASITFPANTNSTQNVTVTIYDDAIVEGNENIVLGYTINANGGNAVAGASNQTNTITIVDNDVALSFGTSSNTAVTLINENFGTAGGTLPTGWTSGLFSGGTNVWTVGSLGTVGTGQGAYITNNITTKPLAYTNSVASDAYLITPSIDGTNLKNAQFSFNYKCLGEQDANGFYDYGNIIYSINGGTFKYLPDLFLSKTNTTSYSISLPDSIFSNTSFRLGFEWVNDNLVGTNPPFSIDDVLLTGTRVVTKTQVEASAGQGKSEYVPSGSEVFIYSTTDSELVCSIKNASVDVGCVTANVTAVGNAKTSFTVNGTNYFRSQKIVQVTPAVANPTATYQLTVYLTAAEIAIWGANKSNLVFLKVADGVNINTDVINNTNSTVVAPTSINDQTATTGYIAYTATFTGFSQFVMFDNLTVLPVQLLSFTGTKQQNDALLKWQTSAEINSASFALQKSNNGLQFNTIYNTPALGVNGSGATYSYVDKQLSNGIHYYRLQSIDVDGQSKFSPIVTVVAGAKSGIAVVPNPVKDIMHIYLDNIDNLQNVVVYDFAGKEIMRYRPTIINGKITINTRALAAGMYVVKITNVKGLVQTTKFLKE